MPSNHVATSKLYTETAIAHAIEEVKDGGSIRKVALEYDLPCNYPVLTPYLTCKSL